MSGERDATARRLALGLGGIAGGGGAAQDPVAVAGALAAAIPGLQIEALAGRGGMGAVYRAVQTRLGRTVAVKLLPPGATADPLAHERFEREARVLAALAHPGVLHIFDFGVLADGTPYLVTEWAEGGDLAAQLQGRAQAPERVLAWVAEIAEALDAVHAGGVLHRDLKPANVLLRGDGRLALGDFGLARANGAGFTTALTLSGVVMGTVDYLAPEQMGAGATSAEGAEAERARVGVAVDVYALGVMSYQMLCGRLPRGVFEPVSRAVGLPRAVDAVIASALASEPGRRPASAGEFARRLGAALGARGRPRAGAATNARRVGWALGMLAAAVALAGLVWWPGRGEAPALVPGDAGEVEQRAAAEKVVEAGRSGMSEAAAPAAAGKADVLRAIRLGEHAVSGGWVWHGRELRVDDAVGLLRVPVAAPADFRYELVVEFTREAGQHSVGVILPTAAGTGFFELDAWELGLGGLQEVDGRDLRVSGLGFAASLQNGVRQQISLKVDGARVGVTWNEVWRGELDLRGRRFSVPAIWGAEGAGDWPVASPGLATWRSPTVFHRVDWRTP